MTPLELTYGQALSISLAGNLVAIVAVVVGWLSSRGGLRHDSEEARKARLTARREVVYTDAIRLLAETNDFLKSVVDASYAGHEQQHHYQGLAERGGEVEVSMSLFASKPVQVPRGAVWSAAAHKMLETLSERPDRAETALVEFATHRKELITRVRWDLGNRT